MFIDILVNLSIQNHKLTSPPSITLRCAIPGYADDQFHVTNETHALLLNHTIPWEEGKRSQCRMYNNFNYDTFVSEVHCDGPANGSDITSSELVYATNGGNSNETTSCEKWVFDKSVFDSTISADVSFSRVCTICMQTELCIHLYFSFVCLLFQLAFPHPPPLPPTAPFPSLLSLFSSRVSKKILVVECCIDPSTSSCSCLACSACLLYLYF